MLNKSSTIPGMGMINIRPPGYKEEDLCGTWTVRTLFETGALISAFPFKKVLEKTKNKMGGRRPEGHITYPRSKKIEETSRRQRKKCGGVF
jgi:hypothetical protein